MRKRPRLQRVWHSSLHNAWHKDGKYDRDEEECGHISQQVAAFPNVAQGLSRHVAPCAALDHMVNQIMLLYASGFREAKSKNIPSVA